MDRIMTASDRIWCVWMYSFHLNVYASPIAAMFACPNYFYWWDAILINSSNICHICGNPFAGAYIVFVNNILFNGKYCKLKLQYLQHQFSITSRYTDVIMTTMASLINSLTVVYSTVYSDTDQRKHQSSASLAFVWGIHRDRWIHRTNGQLRGKCFHLMTSSCAEP